MPLYEYHCPDCDYRGELLTEMGKAHTDCPECKGQNLEKLISSSFSFSIRKNSCGDSGACPSGGRCGGGCPLSG